MKKTNTPTPSSPTSESRIPEAFLHYIWKTKNYKHELISTDGRPIKLIHPGFHNHDAGPDFLDGKIEYDGIVWAGHIELHVVSSDWYRHHHQVDPAYDQVVLHVVWEDDRLVTDMHLNPITTLELKNLVDLDLLDKTHHLIYSKHRLPCATRINSISTFWLNAWKERQLVERLEYRTRKIHKRLTEVKGDWEQVACELLFRSMGFHANSDGLEELARVTSWKQLRKVIHDQKALQALLFGRGGFLSEPASDLFQQDLQKEYQYLQIKYKIASGIFIKWNFKGARPANFPTIRIAQLATLLFEKHSLIRTVLEADNIDKMKLIFNISLPEYWSTHYSFKKQVDKTRIRLSNSSIQLLIINYCIPILYAYGREHHKEELKERAIKLLYALPAETNAITNGFSKAGVPCRCAAETQALLHSYREYCSSKRCLDCQVGHRIVGNKKPC